MYLGLYSPWVDLPVHGSMERFCTESYLALLTGSGRGVEATAVTRGGSTVLIHTVEPIGGKAEQHRHLVSIFSVIWIATNSKGHPTQSYSSVSLFPRTEAPFIYNVQVSAKKQGRFLVSRPRGHAHVWAPSTERWQHRWVLLHPEKYSFELHLLKWVRCQ